jgi:hypothetical protein
MTLSDCPVQWSVSALCGAVDVHGWSETEGQEIVVATERERESDTA